MITPEIIAGIIGLFGGIISIAAVFVAARMYIAKRRVDAELETQRHQHALDATAQQQAHEENMRELSARQDMAERKAELAASSGESVLVLARSITGMSEVIAESNKQWAEDRAIAHKQNADFNQTTAAGVMANTALATNISDNTAATTANSNTVAQLVTEVTTLRTAVETALTHVEGSAEERREVKDVLERVRDHFDKQEHAARNETQVAALMAVNARRKTGEVAAVSSDNENGSSD